MLFLMLLIITLIGIGVCFHYHLMDKAKTISNNLIGMSRNLQAGEIVNLIGNIESNLVNLKRKPSDFKRLVSLLKDDYFKLYKLIKQVK